LKKKLEAKLKKIKALVLDCDGILTDTKIYYMGNVEGVEQWSRSYSIRDGFGIAKLKKAGFIVSVITTSKSPDITARMRHLKIDPFYDGVEDKIVAWNSFLAAHKLKADNVAYMGDDDPDIPLLKLAGFSASVEDAMPEVLENVDYVTKRPAGLGAVREVCELILKGSRNGRA